MRSRNLDSFLSFIFACTWSFGSILYVPGAAAVVAVVVVAEAVIAVVETVDVAVCAAVLALQSVAAAVDRDRAEAKASKDLQCQHLQAGGGRTESTGSGTGDAGGSEGGSEGTDRAWRGPSSLGCRRLRLHSCHRRRKSNLGCCRVGGC